MVSGVSGVASPVTPETIISQPVLDEGGEDSAILVEPVVVDVEDPEEGKSTS